MANDGEAGYRSHIAKKTDRLKQQKLVLDALDGNIQKAVAKVEETLDGLRLGVPIRVLVEKEDDLEQYLVFHRYKGSRVWRLVVQTCGDLDPDPLSERLLAEVGREERGNIFQHYIPNLIDAAVKQFDDKIAARQAALAKVDAMLEAIGSDSDTSDEGVSK
jgi:hypothetical protein